MTITFTLVNPGSI